LEYKIKETRNIGNYKNDHITNKSIKIIQEYNENNPSRSREYPINNSIYQDYYLSRETRNIHSSHSKSFKNSNNDEFNKKFVLRNNKENSNNDLFYLSNEEFNSQADGQEENPEQHNHNLQKSYYNDELNDNNNNNYQSMNSSYIGNKKKNHSTSNINNYSNFNIGYIPDALSRSPAMRKSIDRSKILRRDYGCYERFRKSNNYESIDNDYNLNENNDQFENVNLEENNLHDNSAMNLSPERYLKNNTYNSSQNNSININGSVDQSRNVTHNRSPIRKELLFNSQKHETRSPLRSNNEYAYKRLNFSNAFSNHNYTVNSHIYNYSNENLSFDNIKNLSMFLVKSDHHKIKSHNLATFLYDLLIVDSLSESNKESLSLRTDISLRYLFEIFDISNRNSISLVDFQDILKKLEIYVPLPELKLTFKRFDTDMDGRLE